MHNIFVMQGLWWIPSPISLERDILTVLYAQYICYAGTVVLLSYLSRERYPDCIVCTIFVMQGLWFSSPISLGREVMQPAPYMRKRFGLWEGIMIVDIWILLKASASGMTFAFANH
jgi:hypothetical protein